MNFSRLLYDPEAANRALDKLYSTAISLKSVYSNLKESSEESITNNFLGIIKCNQILSDTRTLTPIAKNSKKCAEIEKSALDTIGVIKSNLSLIAQDLEPEEFLNDLSSIFQILNENNIQIQDKNHFILPKSGSIIIGTTMDCGDKSIVFTTEYTDSDIKKYLNLFNDPIRLENYNYGILLDNNLDSTLNNLLNNNVVNLDQIIKNSTIFDNFIKSSVNEKVDVNDAFHTLTNYFSTNLEKSYQHNKDLLFKFKSNLNGKEINKISNILKLRNNDKYKFMALLKE